MKVKRDSIVQPSLRMAGPVKRQISAEDAAAVRLRKAIGYGGGQKAVAERAGLYTSLVARYLQPGASRKLDAMQKIARAAGVSDEWLLVGSGTMERDAAAGIVAARLAPSIGGAAGIDPELMRIAIEGVETALELEESRMEPAAKAELIMKICEHFAAAPRPRLASVIRLVKDGSMRRAR
ncbi:MAG: helix-turn-helix domain-containing protein [Candidatus Binataceae bacterium]